MMWDARHLRLGALLAVPILIHMITPAVSETLPEALVKAYQGNPMLTLERAKLRATDENVPQALSGYRPQVTVGLSAGLLAVRNLMVGGDSQSATLKPWQAGLTVNQILYNGNKTASQVRQAEAQVKSGREALRNTEQAVLLDAVTVYTGVLANQSTVEAQRANVTFLRGTLETAQRRYGTGDVTTTDVAQAEARLSRGTADLNNAEVNLAVSQATYSQVVGSPPGRLVQAEPVDRLLPRAKSEAVAISRAEHPTILAATYDVDAAQSAIRVAESALLPTLGVQGNVSRMSSTDTSNLDMKRSDQASIVGQLNIPIYDGGMAPSQVRQAKETVGQMRSELHKIRLQAETAVTAAWVTNEGSRISLTAAESELRAATVALAGVQRESQTGQRTTIDVLKRATGFGHGSFTASSRRSVIAWWHPIRC